MGIHNLEFYIHLLWVVSYENVMFSLSEAWEKDWNPVHYFLHIG